MLQTKIADMDIKMSKMDINSLLEIIEYCDSYKISTMFNTRVHPQWGFESRRNNNQHLIYVISGNGYYIINGREIALTQGQFLFLSRGTLHSSGIKGNDRPVIMPIRFSFIKNGIICDEIIKKPIFLMSSFHQSNYIEPLMYKLFQLHTNPKEDMQYKLQIGTIIKLLLLTFAEQNGKEKSSDERIQNILKQIHESPWKRYTLDDLATSCNLSMKQFCRLFKKEVNRSPKDYIRYYRCQYASEELSNSKKSIKEISEILGYPDPYTFSKQFKKYLGFSPREWRKTQ